MQSSTVSSCPLGGQTGDIGWFTLQTLISLINLAAIFLNVLFFFVCAKGGVIDKNTRLMLCTISLCFSVNAVAGLLYNVYFFIIGIYSFPMNPQQDWWCTVINVLMVPWDAATVLLMIGVGVERFLATKPQMPKKVVAFYVKIIYSISWSAAAFVTIQYFLNLSNQGTCVCDGASLTDSSGLMIRIAICALFEAATISLFGYVMLHSRNEAYSLGINTAKYSLTKRFQIHETLRATQMLLPGVVLHALLYLSYLLLLFPIRHLRASSSLTLHQYNLSTIVFAFPSIHAVAHPILCMSRHYYLRQRMHDVCATIFCRRSLPRLVDDGLLLEPKVSARSEGLGSKEISRDTVRNSFKEDRGGGSGVEFRVAPERHAEILNTFWDRK